jgi:hypothetical protein
VTIVYRETDPVSGRWVGLGADLSAFQIDSNFYEAITRIATLEAGSSSTVSIASISISGNQLTFNMTNSTVQGPFTIPSQTFVDRGTWLPITSYDVNDTFNINGTLYRVIFAHTSASTFSAGANDGLGHNYYSAMISVPGNAIATGGTVGQVYTKTTTSDFAANWQFVNAIRVTFSASTGSALTATNVASALEELETLIDAGLADRHLSELTDISFNTAGPVSGELLGFNGSKWTNVTLSVTFSEISDIVLTSATIGDLLSFDGTHWVNVTQSTLTVAFSQITGSASASQLRNATVTALGTTGTVSLDPTLGDVFSITPAGGITINAASAPAGAEITLIVTTSGTSSFNVTPTTNFKSQGALATGTISAKTFAMKFVGDGTNLVEVSRTTAM